MCTIAKQRRKIEICSCFEQNKSVALIKRRKEPGCGTVERKVHVTTATLKKRRQMCAPLLRHYVPPVHCINLRLLAFCSRIVRLYNRAKSIDSGETPVFFPSRIGGNAQRLARCCVANAATPKNGNRLVMCR